MGRLEVRVLPRASRNAIEGWDAAGRLKVRLTAPPVGGAANQALLALLAEALGVAKSRVTVERGSTGRTKLVRVEGLDDDAVRRALGGTEAAPGAGGRAHS